MALRSLSVCDDTHTRKALAPDNTTLIVHSGLYLCDDDTHTGQPPEALLARKGRKSHYKGSQPLALFSQAEWSNYIPQTTLLLELAFTGV